MASSALSRTGPAVKTASLFVPRCSTIRQQSLWKQGWQKARHHSGVREAVVGASTAKPQPPPLAVLPNGVLLRSLAMAMVTSKPYLLQPSLSLLAYLSMPGRGFFLNVDRNPVLHFLLKKTFYKQFCTGENEAEIRDTMKHFRSMGFRGTILTCAKETTFNHQTNEAHGMGVSTEAKGDAQRCANIEAWRKQTLVSADTLSEGDQLAIKISGAGPKANEALSRGELPPPQMMDALADIATHCKERGAFILVDAESQHFQPGIARTALEIMRQFNRDGYARIYNTYQAYLKSTPETLRQHLDVASQEGFTLGLKLVRGAYLYTDERSRILDTKQQTDDQYNAIAQGALRQEIGEFGGLNGRPFPSVNLFLASHNKQSVLAAYNLHQQRLEANLPTVPVRYAQLHGMSDELSFGLLGLKQSSSDGGPEVYKCSTWGSMGECMAYLMRRAVENRDAVSRTVDEYNALKHEMKRRLKSIFLA